MAFTPTEEAQLRAVITAFESGKTISEILASTEVFTTDVLEIVQSAVSKKATIAQIVTLVDSELGIASISSKLSGIEAGAQVNIIESVKVNNTVLPISSKSVNVTVPTQPSDINAENVSNKSTLTTLGNSDTLYPSQNAVKTYVDDAVASGAPDATTTTKGKVKLAGDLSGTADTPTVPGLLTKEPTLPTTPDNPESKFLNGNRQWAEMVMGSGGYASNVYFTNLTSTIVGSYKQTSGTHELTETIASGTCNNNEVLIHAYLFEHPVGITTIDAGVWRITLNSAIDASAGDSKFKFVQYKRSSAGVETDMFTVYSNTIENRVGYEGYLNNVFETVQPSFTVEDTDRLGCRVYATTTAAGSRTLSYKVGDGNASYLNTPLALRHDQNRDKNGNPLYQHLTSAQVAKVDATSGTNTGDETLTSIKTKLGAASAVSDGYLTSNMFNVFNNSEPSFTKRTGFNKNFGTTTGTVLEGRTFGTAANSAVGDFLSSSGGLLSGFLRVNTEPIGYGVNTGYIYYGNGTLDRWMGYDGGFKLQDGTGVKTIWHSGNLTPSLTTNYIPKWNGSSFVNSLISDDPSRASVTVNGSDNTRLLFYTSTGEGDSNNRNWAIRTSKNNYGDFVIQQSISKDSNPILGAYDRLSILNSGEILVHSTTPSALPTTGALVVDGGVGANHVRANNFYGNGSNLTGVQLPITLTTNGTSGTATFSGNVLNVPNYTSTGIGGSYTASISSGSNTANPVVYSSLYTKNGTVYSSVIKGYIECAGSQGNTCTFNVSTYNGSTANLSIIGVGAQGTNIILGSGSTGSNVVMSFTNPVGSGGIGFTLIIHYTN